LADVPLLNDKAFFKELLAGVPDELTGHRDGEPTTGGVEATDPPSVS
jgi:hypothetical protein